MPACELLLVSALRTGSDWRAQSDVAARTDPRLSRLARMNVREPSIDPAFRTDSFRRNKARETRSAHSSFLGIERMRASQHPYLLTFAARCHRTGELGIAETADLPPLSASRMEVAKPLDLVALAARFDRFGKTRVAGSADSSQTWVRVLIIQPLLVATLGAA